jgi:Tfp pilus assembly PilM family ATPase
MLLKGLHRTSAIGLDLALGHVVRAPATAGASPGRTTEVDRLLKSGSFRGRSVVTALNPPEVEFHVLEVPKAALQDVANAHQVIHWEIGRLTSLSTDQIETRHWLLPSRQGTTASAIGVSVTRDTVTRLLRICSESRLACASVDTGATAIHRFGTMLRHWPQDEIWGLLDLGARQSRLVLSLGETPILIRHVGSGGQAWTERIAENLQISASTAEIQKKSHGIALAAHREGRRNPEAASHDEVAGLLLGALRGELNEMATEIKRSYEYVLGSYLGKRASDLVLVGAGAAMPNLAGFLGGVLGITVRPASHYLSMPECRLQMDASTKEHVEDFAVAIGLAIQEQQA